MKTQSRWLSFALLSLCIIIVMMAAKPEFPDDSLTEGRKPALETRARSEPRRSSNDKCEALQTVVELERREAALSSPAPVDTAAEFATLEGSIIWDSGAPAVGARVTLRALGPDEVFEVDDLFQDGARCDPEVLVAEASTDDQGRYRLERPLEGQGEDFLVTASLEDSEAAQVVAGSRRRANTLVLAPVRVIEGRVIDQANRPVAGAGVFLFPEPETADLAAIQAQGALTQVSLSDVDGRFRFQASPQAAYALGASRAGEATTLVPVLPGGAREVVIRLAGSMTVTGRVLRERDQSPVAGARVVAAALGAGGHSSATVFCDAEGRFEIAGLTSLDSLHFRVRAEGLAATASLSHPESLTWIERGATAGRVVLRLGAGLEVGGRIQDAEGRSRPGLNLRFRELGSGQIRLAQSDRDGRFHVDALSPGRHRVEVIGSAELLGAASTVFDLHEDRDDLLLETVPTCEVRGRVLRDDGSALPHARVALSSAVLDHREVVSTDEAGFFRLNRIAQGETVLQVSSPGLASHQRVLLVDGDLRLGTITLHAAAAVRGRVRNARGLPCAGAEVSVFDLDDQVFSRVATGSDGSFEIPGLPPQTLRLQVRWESAPCQLIELAALASGTVRDLGVIDLRPGRELTLLVRNEEGKAQRGIIVTCRVLGQHGGQATQVFETDSEGVVNLEGACRGCSVFVMATHAELGFAKVLIGPEEEGLREIRLARP